MKCGAGPGKIHRRRPPRAQPRLSFPRSPLPSIAGSRPFRAGIAFDHPPAGETQQAFRTLRDWRQTMVVKIMPNDKGSPQGKLADAEVHFTDGELQGLRLLGFAVWERRNGDGRNVTFPARTYSVNGERRSFSLLRPVNDPNSQNRVRDLVLQAYADHEAQAAIAS
jgi:hypothetical protein